MFAFASRGTKAVIMAVGGHPDDFARYLEEGRDWRKLTPSEVLQHFLACNLPAVALRRGSLIGEDECFSLNHVCILFTYILFDMVFDSCNLQDWWLISLAFLLVGRACSQIWATNSEYCLRKSAKTTSKNH